MIPLTNDQLREQFRKIYGRMPASLFELDQFRKNRPTRFYEPRTFKRKRKRPDTASSLIAKTPPAELEPMPNDEPASTPTHE